MRATIESISDIETLGLSWRELEGKANPSFFQSWTWIGSWLHSLPDISKVSVLRLESDGNLVGLALLCLRTIWRRPLIRIRSIFVNETGDPALDTLTIEHNGFLLHHAYVERGARAILEHLYRNLQQWDEARISGVESRTANMYRKVSAFPECRLLDRYRTPYFTVDLNKLRNEERGHLSVLSSNSRSQLRRAIREYEKFGPLTVDIAETEPKAHEYLRNLRTLHQRHWEARGAPGAFASTFANRFHNNIIAEGLPRGEIQLAEVRSGLTVIGYLYNFVRDGFVANYQGGFVYDENPKLKPGLVAHHLLIEENLTRGASQYDFLMGDQRYKKSLSTDEGRMHTLVLQRHRYRFFLEQAARTVWHRLSRPRDQKK